MKKNNKGFVLVETLVVSVAIAAIFSVIYTNIVPVLGDYERTENYDDLDTKYVAHWMRMLIMSKGRRDLGTEIQKVRWNSPMTITVDKKIKEEDYMSSSSKIDEFERLKYKDVNVKCGKTADSSGRTYNYFTEPDTCVNFFKRFNVTKLYIVPYDIKNFKEYAKTNLGQSPGLQEYIKSLSNFNVSDEDKKKSDSYRLIVEVEKNTGLKDTEDYFTTYATIELRKEVITDVLYKKP